MFEQGDDLNLEPPTTPPEKAPESSNRTFLIVAGVMAGLVFISLICMAVYAFVIGPSQKAKTSATAMAVETKNAQVAEAKTQTAVALLVSPTSLASPVVEPSETPVVAVASSTETPDPSLAQTETKAVLLTQVAIAQLTPTSLVAGTVEAMPSSGIGDELGLPALIILAVGLVVIIFLSRRLRRSSV